MTNKNLRREDGFTIIEVLIVLAIAGLIMLIVFLAVPALQRNSRNTSRKSDISSLGSALSEYVNNNDGQLPGACTGSSCPFYSNWKPGYYTTPGNLKFVVGTSSSTPPTDPGDVDHIVMESYMTCSGTGAINGSARSVAIVYDVETGGGTPQEQCVTAN
jgi:prepilin-type N-terminal cleavage/methylation domain-containing protein